MHEEHHMKRRSEVSTERHRLTSTGAVFFTINYNGIILLLGGFVVLKAL